MTAPTRLATAALLVSLVAACTRPAAPPPLPQSPAALERWEARGRVALRRDGATPAGGQAGLEWRQAGEAAAVSLRGPFGTGGYEIEALPGGVTLRTAAGAEVRAEPDLAAAEQWLAAELGFAFPLRSARYWLRGLADPAAAALPETDADGRLTRLRQAGWDVAYTEYLAVDGFWLPRKLVLAANPPAGAVRVRVVIDRWLLDTAARPIRQ